MEEYTKVSDTEVKITLTTTNVRDITVSLAALLQTKSDLLENIKNLGIAYQENRQIKLGELAVIENRIKQAQDLGVKEVVDPIA